MLRCIRQYFWSLSYLKVLKEFPYSVSVQFVNIRNINKAAFKKVHIDHFCCCAASRHYRSSSTTFQHTPGGVNAEWPCTSVNHWPPRRHLLAMAIGGRGRPPGLIKLPPGVRVNPNRHHETVPAFRIGGRGPGPCGALRRVNRRSDFPEKPNHTWPFLCV